MVAVAVVAVAAVAYLGQQMVEAAAAADEAVAFGFVCLGQKIEVPSMAAGAEVVAAVAAECLGRQMVVPSHAVYYIVAEEAVHDLASVEQSDVSFPVQRVEEAAVARLNL